MQHRSADVVLDRSWFDNHARTLTPSQRKLSALLLDWAERPRKMLILVSGGPGTGKTYAVRGLLDAFQVDLLAMAYTARIAHNIGGRTIHSSLHLAWGPDTVLGRLEEKLNAVDDVERGIRESEVLMEEFHCSQYPLIVMIDEIAMIPYYLLYWILRFFYDRTEQPLLVIGMGDGHQLLPVASTHNLFGLQRLDARFEDTHRIEFTDSKRFVPDYEIVVERLRRFVDRRDETGMFTYLCGTYPVVQDIQLDVLKRCTRALAFRNATVDNYNKYYISCMITGVRVRLYRLDPESKEPVREEFVDVKTDCKIFVTQNGCSEVANGTMLVFKRYCATKDVLECRLTPPSAATARRFDGNRRRIGEMMVCVRRNKVGSFPVAVGFASTVHKFQGETIDDEAIAINFDGSQDLNLVYTALSRVRSIQQIIALKL